VGGGGPAPRLAAAAAALAWCAALDGCRLRREPVDQALDRMERQPRADAYAATGAFPDGRVLQPAPAGTVARDAADERPVVLTRRALEHGRSRYDIFCAPCHGSAGDGRSWVAANLGAGAIPSLVASGAAAAPEEVYRIVTHGRGRMPSYAGELVPAERWAVAGYLRALRLSGAVPLDSLPPAVRAEAEAALRGTSR
jgi:mono/diheme cytochrome c family protein